MTRKMKRTCKQDRECVLQGCKLECSSLGEVLQACLQGHAQRGGLEIARSRAGA
jgi:hypothetical protein